jgi:ribosomal protein L6
VSRIGKLPVVIPAGVKVTIADNSLTVEGPKGKLSRSYNTMVQVKLENAAVSVTRVNETKEARAFHGLYRNLIHNMVVGVSQGFSKTLVINGVGYRAEVQGKLLVMALGYSNDFIALIPEGIEVKVEPQGNKVIISGIDKEKVGAFAAQIRKLRLPEPYKGKGIRYETEVIKRKVGKTGVK